MREEKSTDNIQTKRYESYERESGLSLNKRTRGRVSTRVDRSLEHEKSKRDETNSKLQRELRACGEQWRANIMILKWFESSPPAVQRIHLYTILVTLHVDTEPDVIHRAKWIMIQILFSE